MESFVKSLPSQRKKEKERKSRHRKSRSSHGFDAGRSSRRGTPPPSSQSPGSFIEATEVQHSPPPAMMGLAAGKSIGNAKEGFDDDAVEEGERHAGSSEETRLSQSQGTVVEATQIKFPPPAMVSASTRESDGSAMMGGVVDRRERNARPLPDIRPSPVHSSMAAVAGFDRAYDEETVGMMNSPVSGREEVHELNENFGQETTDEPRDSTSRKINHPAERNLSLETEPRGNVDRKGGRFTPAERNPSLETEPRGNVDRKGGRFTPAERNLPLETELRGNVGRKGTHFTERDEVRKKSGGETFDESLLLTHNSPSDTNNSGAGRRDEKEVSDVKHSLHGEERDDQVTELVLTSSDIRDCVKAMSVAKQIMEADLSQDPFHNIDIEQWQTTFEDFEKYIAALGNSSSTETEELKQINGHDKVYAIFDRGMDVNDCNALFIYNMMHTISSGIDAHGGRHSHRGQNISSHEAHNKKLNHLAACLDMVFRVSDDFDRVTTAVSASISKAERETITVLTLSRTSVPSSQGDELSSSIIQQPSSSTMPPHLQAMSQVFERFAAKNTRSLQSQLDSTRNTLAVTREGAMDLQRQALKLQDDLQDAQTEAEEAKTRQERAEAELGRQKYEFERREESFERVKEHYKAEIGRQDSELAKVKEQYSRELKEAKAELARVKQSYAEQRATEQRKRKESDHVRDNHPVKHQRSEHHRRHSTYANPHASHREETTSDDEILPSIPRKIEYQATDSFGGDAEESRKTVKVSSRQSRHSTGNVAPRTNYPSAPYELQPPRKSRASSEPKDRSTTHKKEQHRGLASRNGVHLDEHSGRFGQPRGVKQRNPLKSLTENSYADNASDVNFRENETRIKRGRLSKNEQHSHAEGIEGGDGDKTFNFASSRRKERVATNPYLKQSKPTKKAANDSDSNGAPAFAYQEVVRGRGKRQALPGHDCEECRKFHDALGKGYDTGQMVMECSRHRARHIPPSTPPNFWKLTFVDSVGSENSTD